MKRLLISICAAACIAGCAQNSSNGGPTTLQGRFINYNNEYVEFFEMTPDGNYEEIPIEVSPDGTFSITHQFDSDRYDEALFADKFMFRLYLEQGKTYNAEFDLSEEGVESNYSFTGEGAVENEFVKKYANFDAYSLLEDVTSYADCKKQMDAAYEPFFNELKRIGNKKLEKFYKAQIEEMKERLLYHYPFYAVGAKGVYEQDANFNAFVSKHDKCSDEEFEAMANIVFSNVAYLVANMDPTEAIKAAAGCTLNPQRKEMAMTMMIQALINAGATEGINQAYDYLCDNITNEEYLDAIDEYCSNAVLLSAGEDAPDIEFENVDGKVFHLADFRGKPVYIDLWASWCGPCCEEIPYLAKFVESLGSDPEIVCVSISIDEVRSDWTTKLAEDNSPWPQFLATEAGQESISNDYFVAAIPRFMLIDADGKIASVNAPRPSSPNLLESLKELLEITKL